MPTQWTLTLAPDDTGPAHSGRYDLLHKVACAFFRQHSEQDTPFAARLTNAHLTLVWLPDEPPRVTAVPAVLRLGKRTRQVTQMRLHHLPLAELGHESLRGRVHVQTISPVTIRRHGHDYALPDPFLVYDGLARRLRRLAPQLVPDEATREAIHNAVIYHHRIRTQTFPWQGGRSGGFVGSVTFDLTGTSSPAARQVFATLNGFAALGGIGHGTPQGLGAVDVTPAGRHGQPAQGHDRSAREAARPPAGNDGPAADGNATLAPAAAVAAPSGASGQTVGGDDIDD